MRTKNLIVYLGLPVCLASFMSLSACQKRSKAASEFAAYSGNWTSYIGNDCVSFFDLTEEGAVKLTGFEQFHLAFEYEGRLAGKDGRYDYELTPVGVEAGASQKGVGALTLAKEGRKLRLVFEQKPSGVFEKEMVFFKKKEPFDVDFKGKSPTVLDLFKAVYPYTFNSIISDAYNFVVKGKPRYVSEFDRPEKIVDLQNGYICYTGSGAPRSSMECCFWITADKNLYLFAINPLGESPNIPPTVGVGLLFYKYDAAGGFMQEIEPPFVLKKPDDEEHWSFELPQKGTDIKVTFLTDDYNEKSSVTLKWNGNGFDVVK